MLLHSIAEDEDRDSDRRGTQLISIKAAVLITLTVIAVLVALLIILMPGCTAQKNWYLTKKNLNAIASAFQSYAQSNDSGFPPAYELRGGQIAVSNGAPITWATQIAEYLDKENLKNPANDDAWDTLIAYPGSKENVNLSYGANTAVLSAGLRTYDLPNAADLVLVAETIGGGEENSFDPLPFEAPNKRDGFLIGFDDSNTTPSPRSKQVTRLAFRDATSPSARSLHPQHGLAAISPDGGLIILSPSDQFLEAAKRLWVPRR